MDPKYNLAIKLVLAGVAVGVAAYFGADISAYMGALLGGTGVTLPVK